MRKYCVFHFVFMIFLVSCHSTVNNTARSEGLLEWDNLIRQMAALIIENKLDDVELVESRLSIQIRYNRSNSMSEAINGFPGSVDKRGQLFFLHDRMLGLKSADIVGFMAIRPAREVCLRNMDIRMLLPAPQWIMQESFIYFADSIVDKVKETVFILENRGSIRTTQRDDGCIDAVRGVQVAGKNS